MAGEARPVGAGGMALGSAVVLVGIATVSAAIDRLQAQAAQLDPSQSRADAAFAAAAQGLAAVAVGVLLFLVALVVFLAAGARARRAGDEPGRTASLVAGVAAFVLVASLLAALVLPTGPAATAIAFANGGGGAAGAVQLMVFNGTLTGATLGGHASAEDVHDLALVAKTGALRMRLGSGGQPTGTYAVAILEAADGSGAWREVARTQPVSDSTVDVPVATYAGPVRVRVDIQDPGVGQVQYVLGVSFTPKA